jgi:restriction endonuclease S subunit
LKTKSNIIDSYLVEILNTLDLSEYITGLNVPKLNQANLNEIQIPLPPLDVQQQIVDEIGILEKKEKEHKEKVEELKGEILAFYSTTKSDYKEVNLFNEIEII